MHHSSLLALKNKNVLSLVEVKVASSRIHHVLVAGAQCHCDITQGGLHLLRSSISKLGPNYYHDRTFELSDPRYGMVLTAIDDVECREASLPSAERAGFQSRRRRPSTLRFLLWITDSQGPLQILISDQRRGPKMANRSGDESRRAYLRKQAKRLRRLDC